METDAKHGASHGPKHTKLPFSERVARARLRGPDGAVRYATALPPKAFKQAKPYLTADEIAQATEHRRLRQEKYEADQQRALAEEAAAVRASEERACAIKRAGVAMMEAAQAPQDDPTVERLLQVIRGVRGDKIATVTTSQGSDTFDIAADGQIGHAPFHANLLRTRLAAGLRDGGAVVLRQFLDVRVQRPNVRGEIMWFPDKNLYGAALGDGRVTPLSAAAMEQVERTDANTGATLPREPGVHCLAWPDP